MATVIRGLLRPFFSSLFLEIMDFVARIYTARLRMKFVAHLVKHTAFIGTNNRREMEKLKQSSF